MGHSGLAWSVEPTPRYYAFAPIPPLAHLIEEIWVQEGGVDPDASPDESGSTAILPAARADLVLNWGDPFFELRAEGEIPIPRAAIIGPRTERWEVRGSGRCGLIIVCFHPWAGGPLLGADLTASAGGLLSIGDVYGDARERALLDCAGSEQRVALVQRMLLQWLEDRETDRLSAATAVAIHRAGGRARIQEVAGHLGMSRRHLQRRMTQAIGIPPKKLASLARVHRAIGRLRSGEPEWQVAGDCGYSDQSHLIREVRSFTGMTPTALRQVANEGLVDAFNNDGMSRYL